METVSPAHFKVRSYLLKKLLQANSVGYFLTPVVQLFLKYVLITWVSECFQTSVRVKSSPVLFKSNLKGLALQVFGKRAGIVVNFLSLYILKIAAYLLMNCFVTPSRRGSGGAHTWSTAVNSAKAPISVTCSPGTSALLQGYPAEKGCRINSSLVPSKGLLGLFVQERTVGIPGLWFFVFFFSKINREWLCGS